MKELNSKQWAAMTALLLNPSLEMAARNSDLSLRTLYRYMKNPDFRAYYKHARREQFAHTIETLQHLSNRALSVLEQLMTDKNVGSASRIAAARSILTCALQSTNVDDLHARIAALEHGERPTALPRPPVERRRVDPSVRRRILMLREPIPALPVPVSTHNSHEGAKP